MMSKLLLDEHPLMVMPKLATKIGLNEAIIMQQIHYWNEINKQANNNYKDGYYWTFNSVTQWQEQFPFWSKRTIQRTLNNIEKMKLVVTSNYNKLKIDRTKWYRIDYNVLSELEESPLGQNGVIDMTEWLNELDNLSPPLPETNSENNPEINKRYTITSNGGYIFSYYNERYRELFNVEHPTVTEEQLEQLHDKIQAFKSELGYSDKALMMCIDYHFENLSPNNDGKIFSFVGDSITKSPILRYYDEVEAFL